MTKNNDKILIGLILLAITIAGFIFYMTYFLIPPFNNEIGRASCRERV